MNSRESTCLVGPKMKDVNHLNGHINDLLDNISSTSSSDDDSDSTSEMSVKSNKIEAKAHPAIDRPQMKIIRIKPLTTQNIVHDEETGQYLIKLNHSRNP